MTRKLIACALAGAIFLGAVAPGANANRVAPHVPVVMDAPDDLSTRQGLRIVAGAAAEVVADGLERSYSDMASYVLMELAKDFVVGAGYQLLWRPLHNVTLSTVQRVELGASTFGVLGLVLLRATIQYAATDYLKKKRNWSDGHAKWAALVFELTCKTGTLKLNEFIFAHVTAARHDELKRRRLLFGEHQELHPDAGGDMAKIARAITRMEVRNGVLHFPGVQGSTWSCPSAKVTLPTVPFGTDQNVAVQYSVFLGPAHGWQRRSLGVNSAALQSIPVKTVADGARIWRLTNRTDYGFKIYHQVQYPNLSTTQRNMRWTNIPGQAIDLFPGPNFVWAINSQRKIYACSQPCDGDWREAGGQANAVAVGRGNFIDEYYRFGPVFVYVKSGYVYYRRPERYSASDQWQPVDQNLVPPNVRALLDEREPLQDWRDSAKYIFPGR